MKNASILCLATLICGSVGFSQEQSRAPETSPLLLVQEIPLPNVGGRIDHFTLDAKRKRVIGAALGNNMVEVVDTFSGRDIHSITGAAAPQGVVYVGELDRLSVADATSMKRLDDVAKLDAHPESFQIALSRPVIYVNIATKAKVVLIDRNTHKITDWPLKAGKSNYPMALDESDHRIFVVPRRPAQLVVIDSDSGAMVASVACVNDADDLYYDAGRKRIYVPGGEGFLSVIQQRDRDHYQSLAKVPTTIGARTGLWYEKRDRFYLAVPAGSKQGAALWVYAPED